MIDDSSGQAAEAALERLLETVKAPRALFLRADDRVALEQAVVRARAQLLGTPEPWLTVALVGGTGVGKSTLINALAGAAIAEVSPMRPTTTKLRVYHHRDVASGGLPTELAAQAVCVPHDHTTLRSKVIVDTPDLDSFATHHRATTRALLKAVGLVLYVFSPQNYRDERTWSVVREEQRFSACAAILNKADLVTPEELEAITEDLRCVFARLGLPDIRIFRTVAKPHLAIEREGESTPASDRDDLVALRTFLEQELQHSDIARLRHSQRAQALAHLRAEIDRVAPPTLLDQLDEVTQAVAERVEGTATGLHRALVDPLAMAQANFDRHATLRQHARFWGPFHTWLAITDLLRFGLAGLVRRFLNGTSPGDGTSIEPLFTRSSSTAATDLLRNEAHVLQNLLYARGLPIDHWRTVAVQTDGSQLMADIAATLEAHFGAVVSASDDRGRAVVWMISTIGRVVPAAFVLIGLVVMSRDLLAGDYLGLPLFGHLFAMLIFTFLGLQGVASLLLRSEPRWHNPEVGRQVVYEVLTRTLLGWINTYRSDLEADLTDLHAPITALQSVLVSRAAEKPQDRWDSNPQSVVETPGDLEGLRRSHDR